MKIKIDRPLKEADLAKFPEANPNCVLRISKDLHIVYKNKAVDLLLKDCGFKQKDISKILPKGIKAKIKTTLKTNKAQFDLEVEKRKWARNLQEEELQDIVAKHETCFWRRMASENS